MLAPIESFEAFFLTIKDAVSDLDSIIDFNKDELESKSLLIFNDSQKAQRDSIITQCNIYLLSRFQEINNKLLNGNYFQGNIYPIIDDLLILIKKINDAFNSLITTFIDDSAIQGFKSDLDKIESALNF